MTYLGDQIDILGESEPVVEEESEPVVEELSEPVVEDETTVETMVLQSWRDDLKNAAEEKIKEKA